MNPPRPTDRKRELAELVSADDWIMGLLRAVRSIGLDDWCLAAGVIRNKVWDHLHGYRARTPAADIDVLFFDAVRIDASYETAVERRLSTLVPSVRWEAVNQATVHHYTKDPPNRSIDEAMSRWADPVTAVGVCLTPADEIRVVAPLGLEDLFTLTVRPNLVAPNAAALYRERVVTKRWAERWPKLTIIWPA
jgi:hypothetical protein